MAEWDSFQDGYGSPTELEDAWFQHHVVSKGYPRLRREPKQLPGQARLTDAPVTTTNTESCPDFWTWPVFRLTDDGPERLA